MKKLKNSTPSLKYFLINLIMSYKGLFGIIVLVGLIWAFINAFLPYTLKLIIDHVVTFQGDKSNLFNTTKYYVLAYILLWGALSINMRLLDYAKLKLFPNLRENVMSRMFSYLNQHSHRYFQDNFAGSLINKITDMQSGVVDIFTTLDDLYAQTLGISVAVIILLFIHPIFSIILLGWTVAFLLITFLFLKPIQHLSHDFAESKTSVVGRMVDSITNIMNVRLFARHTEENRYIEQSIKNAVEKDRTMQAKIINMRIFWDLSILVLMGLNLFILLHMYSKNLVTIGDFTFVISLSISIIWSLLKLVGVLLQNIGVKAMRPRQLERF